MVLILEDIEDLRSRQRNPIRVGELPFEVATKLGLLNHGVYLSRQSYQHIINAHGDIDDYKLLLLPQILKQGLIVQEDAKQNVLVISYLDQSSGLRYVTALKIAQSNTEVWISSMYRAKRRQTKRILKRGTILKNHD
jgi:hypothetical protein